MSWQTIPPVYSPLPPQAVRAGIRAAFGGATGAKERLERALATYYGGARLQLTDSGTTALALAMRAAMEASGRNWIALPGYCCYDLVTALNAADGHGVLYDLDLDTLGPSWPSFDEALALRPAAVVVAHLYGLPVDMPRVMERAAQHRVTVIEDNAQGIGGTLNSRPLATFGHLRVLSFGRGKGVTGGRGGALLFSPEWRGAERPAGPAVKGGAKEVTALLAQSVLGRPSLYRIPSSLPFLELGETKYRDPTPPAGISEVSAAVAEVTWRERESEVAARRANASQLVRVVKEAGVRAPRPISGAEPAWLRFPVLGVRHDQSVNRRSRLRALGILPAYPLPLSRLSALRVAVPVGPMVGASMLASRLWTIPTHSLSVLPDGVLLQHLRDNASESGTEASVQLDEPATGT